MYNKEKNKNIGLHVNLSELIDLILCAGNVLKEIYSSSDIIACYLFGSSVFGPKPDIKEKTYKTFSFNKLKFIEKIKTIITYPDVHDIDILVIVNKLKGEENIKEKRGWNTQYSWTSSYEVYYDIVKKQGLLDILYIDKEKINSPYDEKDTVRRSCEKDGVLLFGKDILKTGKKAKWNRRQNNISIIDCIIPNYSELEIKND